MTHILFNFRLILPQFVNLGFMLTFVLDFKKFNFLNNYLFPLPESFFFAIYDLNLSLKLFGFNFKANVVTRERKIVKGLNLESVVLRENQERVMGWPLNNVEKGCVNYNLLLSIIFWKFHFFYIYLNVLLVLTWILLFFFSRAGMRRLCRRRQLRKLLRMLEGIMLVEARNKRWFDCCYWFGWSLMRCRWFYTFMENWKYLYEMFWSSFLVV